MQITELEAALSTRDEEADALRQRLQSERKAVAEQQQSLLELRAKLLQVGHRSRLRRPRSVRPINMSVGPIQCVHRLPPPLQFLDRRPTNRWARMQAEEGRASAMARQAAAEAATRTAVGSGFTLGESVAELGRELADTRAEALQHASAARRAAQDAAAAQESTALLTAQVC